MQNALLHTIISITLTRVPDRLFKTFMFSFLSLMLLSILSVRQAGLKREADFPVAGSVFTNSIQLAFQAWQGATIRSSFDWST